MRTSTKIILTLLGCCIIGFLLWLDPIKTPSDIDATLTIDSNRTEFVIRDIDGNEVGRFNLFDKPRTITIKRNK